MSVFICQVTVGSHATFANAIHLLCVHACFLWEKHTAFIFMWNLMNQSIDLLLLFSVCLNTKTVVVHHFTIHTTIIHICTKRNVDRFTKISFTPFLIPKFYVLHAIMAKTTIPLANRQMSANGQNTRWRDLLIYRLILVSASFWTLRNWLWSVKMILFLFTREKIIPPRFCFCRKKCLTENQ